VLAVELASREEEDTYTSEESANETSDVDQTDTLTPEVRRSGNKLSPNQAHGNDQAHESRIP
jgi:hypothetical protein